jgi:hypothetical protein
MFRRVVVVGVAVVSFLGGHAALAQQRQALPEIGRIKHNLNLADVTILNLDLDAQPGAPFGTTLRLSGSEYGLDMWPHSLRADDFRLLVADDHGMVEVLPAPPRTYRGVLLNPDGTEVPGSRVAASLADGQLAATIALDDGSTWFVQPVTDALADADPRAHAVYKSGDTLPTGGRCGVTDLGDRTFHQDTDAEENGGSRATGYKVCDLAFDADSRFFSLNGSSVPATMADIEYVMNNVEFIYERDTDITYEITVMVVRTSSGSDPYFTIGNPSTMLATFRSVWGGSPFFYIRRDTTHLMTGRNLDGGVIGIAYLDSICHSPSGLGYGLSQSRYSLNLDARASLTAHELGHNWNACHCDEAGCISNPCLIMCSGAAGCPSNSTAFGPGAISQIVSTKNSSGCLFPSSGTLADPLALNFEDTFPSVPDDAKWIYNQGGGVTTAAYNEPSPIYSLNLDCTGSGEYQDDEIRTNFILMGPPSLPHVSVEYWTEHRGVENGEKLVVEYWASNSRWVWLKDVVSNGTDQDNFVFHTHLLTPALNPTAFHNEFRLRFRTEVDQTNDDWYIDDVFIGCRDCDPPLPDPMTWDTPPEPVSTSELTMTARAATDDTPPVEYFFFYHFDGGPNGNSSGWQEPRTYNDDGLLANTVHTYSVKARDGADPPNAGQYSDSGSAATLIETPTGISFGTVTDTSIEVTATGSFTNLTLDQSGLFFEMTPAEGSGANVWVQTETITVTGLSPDTEYTFRVQGRNQNAVTTPWTAPAIQSTTGGAVCATLGDINEDGNLNAADIAGFVRAKLGQPPLPGENQNCADYGGTLEEDIAAFAGDLLGL